MLNIIPLAKNILRPRNFRSVIMTGGKEPPESVDNSRELLLASHREAFGNEKQVPKGFLAVYVGPFHRRFVIPMSFLSMPDFRVLMESAAEEFGFEQTGGLQFPCEEQDFEEILDKCFTKEKLLCKSKKTKYVPKLH